MGKKIKEFTIEGNYGVNSFDFDLSKLENGIYLINFNNNDIKSTQKLILSR